MTSQTVGVSARESRGPVEKQRTKARVLMVCEKFPPFNVSGSARPFQFAKRLPALGYDVHVVASVVPAGHDRDDELAAQLDGICEVSRGELWIEAGKRYVLRCFGGEVAAQHANEPLLATYFGALPPEQGRQPGLWFRFVWGSTWRVYWHVDWAGPAVLLGLRSHLRRPFDLIWVTAPHFRSLMAGYWLSILVRRPLILDLRDPWTYGSLWPPRTPGAARIELKWAKRILRRAERIIFTSPFTTQEMKRRFPGRPAARMCTITNGFTEAAVAPRRDEHNDKLLFRYVGMLNDRRTPDVLLAALREASRDAELAKDVRLQFIGGMAGYEKKISQYGLAGQVEDIGRVSRSESIRYIRGSDVNVLLQTITEGDDVISGKAYEYLAAGKPILAVVSEGGGDAWLVKKTQLGVVVPFTNPQRVAQAIRDYWREWKAGTLNKSSANIDLTPFTWNHLSRQLASVFDDVLRERVGAG